MQSLGSNASLRNITEKIGDVSLSGEANKLVVGVDFGTTYSG